MIDARLELEASFKCPSCGGIPYRLFRRATADHPDIFTHVLWPTDPSILPPSDPRTIVCPTDGSALTRIAA